jgi:hypothetical protein
LFRYRFIGCTWAKNLPGVNTEMKLEFLIHLILFGNNSIVILPVGQISILHAIHTKSKLLANEVLLPKLMFWLAISTAISIITLLCFYPGV